MHFTNINYMAIGVGLLGPAMAGHQAVSQCHYLLCEIVNFVFFSIEVAP